MAELPLKPLLECLSVDNLLRMFVAVLLEQRVLMCSRHYRLLTLAGEAVQQLLHPLRWAGTPNMS